MDVDLAAQLRAGIRTGDEFRPRTVARPEYRYLHPVVVTLDVSPYPAPAADAAVLSDDPVAPEETSVSDVSEATFLELAPAPPAIDDVSELPDYIVLADDVAGADSIARAANDEPIGLPEYVVSPEEMAVDDMSDVVPPDVALDPTATDDVSDLPDYIVRADGLVRADLVRSVDASIEEPSTSDYPVLPDLGEASVALEETDVALRKIREQMSSEVEPLRRRRLRRGFIAASGLGAVAALAVFAVDVQQGVATMPGWLSF